MSLALKRIKEYIDSKGINIHAFEKSVNISNGAFASQLKKNKTIGVDKLENILKIYSDLNPDWVLTGNGDMLKQLTAQHSDVNSSTLFMMQKNCEQTVDSLNNVIAAQQKIISVLEELVAQKMTIVQKKPDSV